MLLEALRGTAIGVNLGLLALLASEAFAELPIWLRAVSTLMAATFALLMAALVDQIRLRPRHLLWQIARYLCWAPALIFAFGSLDMGMVSGQETLGIVAMAVVSLWNWIAKSRQELKYA